METIGGAMFVINTQLANEVIILFPEMPAYTTHAHFIALGYAPRSVTTLRCLKSHEPAPSFQHAELHNS